MPSPVLEHLDLVLQAVGTPLRILVGVETWYILCFRSFDHLHEGVETGLGRTSQPVEFVFC